MPLTRKEKEESISNLTNLLGEYENVVIWEYVGLSSNKLQVLRQEFLDNDSKMKVFKNRLVKIVFDRSNKTDAHDALIGPNALLFLKEDSNSLKILSKLISDNKDLKWKGGYIDGEWQDASTIATIASLPGKQDLLGMLANVLQAPITSIAIGLLEVSKTVGDSQPIQNSETKNASSEEES